MKKFIILFLIIPMISFARITSVDVQQEGMLNQLLNTKGIDSITIKGNLNADDLTYLRKNYQSVKYLDLKEATINGNTIPSYAFTIRELKEIILPDNLITIQSYSFWGCRNLSSVTLPEGLRHIEENSFRECSSLQEINLPHTLITLGDAAFNSVALESIVIPSSVTSLGRDIFRAASALREVTIGSGVSEIKRGSFYGCLSLEEVTILSNLYRVESYAFEFCTIQKLVLYTEVIPVVDDIAYVFHTVPLEGITVYVPGDMVDKYTEHPEWSKMNIETIESLTGNLPVQSSMSVYTKGNTVYIESERPDEVSVYDLSGKLITRKLIGPGTTALPLRKGIFIVSTGQITQKIVLRNN